MATATKSVLIEVRDEAAGVLVETPRGHVFHAVHPRLVHMHGVEFRSVQAAEAAVRDALKGMARAG